MPASASTSSSWRERGTMMRVSDEQTWPVRKHSAPASVAAAVPRSMSSRITAADLPPSSSVQRAMRSPQIEAIRRPATVEPVKVILSTRGSRDEQLGDLAVGGEHVEHAGRQPDRLGDLGDHVGLARRLGRRLEHDGAAGDERGGDLVGDQAEGRVPRDDRPDDADRLADEQAERAAGGRRGRLLERERVGQPGVVVEGARRRPSPGVLGDARASTPDWRGQMSPRSSDRALSPAPEGPEVARPARRG